MYDMWHLFTDGACNNSSNQRGGWAFIVKHTTQDKVYQVGFGASGKGDTTSNRMELFAIYAALKHTPDMSDILLHTDSTYSADCLMHWHRGWEQNNWISRMGTPVMNKDLIQRVLLEMKRFNQVIIKHVPRNSTAEMDWVDRQAKAGKSMVGHYLGPLPEELPLHMLYKKPPDCKDPNFKPVRVKKTKVKKDTWGVVQLNPIKKQPDKPPKIVAPVWNYHPGMRLTNNSKNTVKIIQLEEPLPRVSYANTNGWRVRIIFASGKGVNRSTQELSVDSLNQFYVPKNN